MAKIHTPPPPPPAPGPPPPAPAPPPPLRGATSTHPPPATAPAPIPLPTGESASFEAATANPARTWEPGPDDAPAPAPAPRTRAIAASEATIRQEFASRTLNAEGRAQCDQVRQIFTDTLTLLEQRVPVGHYRSTIVAKLKEACMLAVEAVSLKPDVQG